MCGKWGLKMFDVISWPYQDASLLHRASFDRITGYCVYLQLHQ